MLDQSELALNCELSNEYPKLGEIMLTCALELLVPRTEIKTHKIKHFFLLILILYVPVNSFSVMSGRVFLG